MALTKVSGGILDPGINVAGIVTATGFDGPFTGGSSKNITAGIITATGFDLNGNGDISGNLVIGGNLTANGDFTTLNTTLREVEILRVDANTTAVAGIITQRGSGDILRLYDTTTEVFSVEDGGKVKIGMGALGTNTSDYDAAANNLIVGTGSGDEGITILSGQSVGHHGSIFFADGTGATNSKRGQIRYEQNSERMKFFTAGTQKLTIDINGKVGIGSEIPAVLLDVQGHAGGGAQHTIRSKSTAANASNFVRSESSDGLYIGLLKYGTGHSAYGALPAGGGAVYANSSVPITIMSDGGSGYINFATGGNTERLRITSTGQFHMGGTPGWTYASQKFVVVEPSNALGMILQGNNANQGVNLTLQNINNTVNAYSDISFADDGGQIFGAIRGKVVDRDNNHGEIQFHTSSGSLGQQVTIDKDGNVIIGTSTWQYKKPLNVQGESGSILSLYNGDTTSYAANTYSAIELKILTGNTGNTFGALEIRGIKEEGTNGNNARALTFYTGLNGGGNAERLRIASDGVLKIERGSASDTALEINTTSTNHACRIKFNESGSTKAQIAYSHGNDQLEIIGATGNSLAFFSGGSQVWNIDTNGHLLPNSAGAVNIGSATAEIGHVYLANSKAIYLGSNQAGDLFNDGTDTYLRNSASNGQILLRSNGNILISNYAADEYRIKTFNNGAVELYYDQSAHATAKLATTATGVSVHGEVAASQDYPNFRPTIDFNFAAEKKLDPRITYERTGPASFVNEFGKVVKVGDNAPRFDHDPMTRESKGLLIEESRTNIAEVSEDFDDTTHWEKYSVTVTTNVATAPDGTLTADNIIPASGSAAARYLYFSNNEFPLATSTTYTTSIFVKKNGLRYFAFQAHDNGSGSGHRAGFDLDNGTVVSGTPNNMGSASGVSASIVEFPNGWFRCILTGTTAGSGSIGRTAFCFSSALNAQASVGAITADGSNGGYVWGHQVEAGAFATSYIPTTLSIATRGEDVVRIMDDDFTDIFGTEFEHFSVVADFDNSNSLDGNNASIIEWWSDDNNYENRIQIMKDNSSPYHIETRAISGNSGIFTNGNLSASSKAATNRFATSWSVDYSTNSGASRRWAFSFSGEDVDVVGDDSSTAVPTFTRFGIGCSPRLLNLTRGVLLFKRLMVYNQTLSDNQLRTLSS
jgi:hypothetical protein